MSSVLWMQAGWENFKDSLGPAEDGDELRLALLVLGDGSSGDGEGVSSVAQCLETVVSNRGRGGYAMGAMKVIKEREDWNERLVADLMQ